jgi:hypothetical protein
MLYFILAILCYLVGKEHGSREVANKPLTNEELLSELAIQRNLNNSLLSDIRHLRDKNNQLLEENWKLKNK